MSKKLGEKALFEAVMFFVMTFHQFAIKHFRRRIFCCIFPGFKKQIVRRIF
jgi:hypothetical protein